MSEWAVPRSLGGPSATGTARNERVQRRLLGMAVLKPELLSPLAGPPALPGPAIMAGYRATSILSRFHSSDASLGVAESPITVDRAQVAR